MLILTALLCIIVVFIPVLNSSHPRSVGQCCELVEPQRSQHGLATHWNEKQCSSESVFVTTLVAKLTHRTVCLTAGC